MLYHRGLMRHKVQGFRGLLKSAAPLVRNVTSGVLGGGIPQYRAPPPQYYAPPTPPSTLSTLLLLLLLLLLDEKE